jgi:PAS domain S-box-containing protein
LLDTGNVTVVGELRSLVDVWDWASTPLGPRENWSSSLRTIVSTIIASAFPMAVRWGPEFVLIYNDGYRPILGDKHPWALGLPFREAWPEVQDRLAPLHRELLAGRRDAFFAPDLPLRIQRHGNAWEEALFTVCYSPVPDDTAPSGVGGVFIAAVETTERVRTENALRASEERFQFALKAGGVVGTWDWDIRKNLIFGDASFARLYGLAPEKLVAGANPAEVNAAIHPLDRERLSQRVRKAVETAGELSDEYRVLQPDGREQRVISRGRCFNDAEGKPLRFPGVLVDITDRKNAEKQLRDLNETLEAQVAEKTKERDRIWKVSQDLLGVASFEGRLLSVSPAWTSVLGWSEQELLATPYTHLRHPDDTAATLSHHELMAAGSPARRFENRYRHKDGSYACRKMA